MSKYFITKNKYCADAIYFMTNIRYYKFTNDNNEEMYSFVKDKKIYEAYKIIMDTKNKNLNN
ncbi:hypothetical protein FDC35_03935 [Clostridium botulinum]|nr:hypothetical protein [Clostridium botulinum]NFO41130.1 hypothetical protein [Clostridium botulinum]NFP00062.1 hypothetical protein [Clostridium botulinum]